MRHIPVLAVAGALVFVALLTDMAAKNASAEQTEQTNETVACVKLYEAAPKPWCQPLPPNYYAPKP